MSEPKPAVGVPYLSAFQLRLIAEAASGLRGEHVNFVARPDGSVREVRSGAPAAGEPGPEIEPLTEVVVVPAFTEDRLPEKPALVRAVIEAQGAGPVNLLALPNELGRADAVFWSESAVEKFLIPYYASVYGSKAALAVGDILEAFHGDRGDGARSDDEQLTYAMAHIPKSEYVMLGSSPGAEDDALVPDLVVLFENPATGEHGAAPLAEFLRRRRERRQG